MTNPERPVGVKDIANALKVSIGTVDRALHNRPGVNEKTKALVQKKAKELGYQPNLAAQALKLNRRLAVAAVLPKHIAHFFDPLRDGIRAAAASAVGVNLTLEFFEYPRLGGGDIEAFQRAMQKQFDGMIFLPGDVRKYDPLIRKVAENGTAVMCVGSDAPGTDRVGAVSAHASVSGAVAAELLSHTLTSKAEVAIFSGELSTLDHVEKLRGFAAALAVIAPHLTLLPALESHDRPREAYGQAIELMQRKPHPAGIYISTANSMPVLQALEELGLLGKVKVVTTDLFRELVPLIETGKVLATLHQRPFTQGKLALENLLIYLLRDRRPQPVVQLAPHVIFRMNLALFANQIGSRTDEEVEFAER
ncbi:LacI family DNA-binding transcriptional regulator [Paracidobacterium acidisoli]|uniref:LacI family DNA-binding transcriptional regulator n=1 Tax=Paracidobacterium acidisoli TaxID=2303751 RepID=A0A372IT28_9BACT|nr:LacI family DNA-binding transcriptional regulator [Paracidobacterium acidisoli]MBT9329511.1 LacI family DNA-binding transcriptional regulator [Paracidobacterium acidisoli]